MDGIGVLGEAGQPHEGGGGELLLVAAPLLMGRGGGTGIRAIARHRLRRVIYVGAERLPRAAQLTGQPTGEWAMASAPQLFRPPWDGCGERGLEVSLALAEGELLACLEGWVRGIWVGLGMGSW